MAYYPTIILCLTSYIALLVQAQVSKYQPCPLLGPFLPPPTIDPSSDVIQSATKNFDALLDQYVQAGDGEFGPITPNTTSFSVALFAGSTYVMNGNTTVPYFYEYHHTAKKSDRIIDKNSVFAIGDLTQLFTALSARINYGSTGLTKSVTEFLPELLAATNISRGNEIDEVDWADISLAALEGHMAGIIRTCEWERLNVQATENGATNFLTANACNFTVICQRDHFVTKLLSAPPVELPESTPIYSHAGIQLLAFAIESSSGVPFATQLSKQILEPLMMENTIFPSYNKSTIDPSLANITTLEPASVGLTSTISDLSRFGRAILTSELLSPVESRRWLQPRTSTSNLRNSVGQPWEIYHFGQTPTDPIVEIYTKSGSIGKYSSYFGVVPAYDVGFTILAVDTETETPDLNAYADIILGALLQIDALGRQEANATLSGGYSAQSSNGTSTLMLTIDDGEPGIEVKSLMLDGTNWLDKIAQMAGITNAANLDLRIYPTDVEHPGKAGGRMQVFQGVIQDKGALVDAGTPTCTSWMTVGIIENHGQPLDRFVIEFDGAGKAQSVTWAAFNAIYQREE